VPFSFQLPPKSDIFVPFSDKYITFSLKKQAAEIKTPRWFFYNKKAPASQQALFSEIITR
jgi:hypothetical protein